MKWTKEQEARLKALCMDGKLSNAELAREFNVPVEEIHAKRSGLGITRAKCEAARSAPAPAEKRTEAEIEAEIKKVQAAFDAAMHKGERCTARLRELYDEPSVAIREARS